MATQRSVAHDTEGCQHHASSSIQKQAPLRKVHSDKYIGSVLGNAEAAQLTCFLAFSVTSSLSCAIVLRINDTRAVKCKLQQLSRADYRQPPRPAAVISGALLRKHEQLRVSDRGRVERGVTVSVTTHDAAKQLFF